MKIRWALRMVAAEHGVWSGSQLQRLLATRAGLKLSSPSISALLTKEPRELKVSTLAALCTALDCTPNDLLVIEASPATALDPLGTGEAS